MNLSKRRSLQVFVLVGILCGSVFIPVTLGVVRTTSSELSMMSLNEASVVAFAQIVALDNDELHLNSYEILADESGRILCYVFHLSPLGYIVVSAYNVLPPVIAYSETGTFHLEGGILAELIKADLSSRLEYLSEISSGFIVDNQIQWNMYLTENLVFEEQEVFFQWPALGTTRSGGWVDTKWHQNAPFNNMVPIDQSSGSRSVAGCPAVTMAQICNYHQTINGIVFDDSDDYYHSYAGNNFWIDDDHVLYDFPSFPELNSYLDDLVLHYQQGIELTDDDKAALIFACGTAATQVYHPTGSGTFGVNQAYTAYQRFNFDDVDLLDENDPDVYERIQDNMKDGLPVHLAVVNEGWTVGHNLVIDGYNSEGYYHLNFGWGGSYDGWYKLPEELPYELTVLEGVVVDITDDNAISNLHGLGNLYWTNIRPGTTITDSFQIQNTGDPGSSINWEIVSWPDWGTWTFTPDTGMGLTPESGPFTIDVTFDVPDEKNADFQGEIRLNNIDNTSDYCIIHVLLSTPMMYTYQSILLQFLQNHPNIFPMIQKIIRYNLGI